MRHEESSLQIACVKWFRMQYPQYSKLLIAIPNHAVLSGDATQRARQWKRLGAEGAVTGAADLVLFKTKHDLYPVRPSNLLLTRIQTFNGCFFEMKTDKGKQSPSQKEFQRQVTEQGYEYVIIRDLDSFIKKVKEYL